LLLLFKEFYGDPSLWDFDPEDRLRRLDEQPDWQQALTPEVQNFHQQICEEMEAAQTSPADYRSRLETVCSNRDSITDLAGSLLHELERAVDNLAAIDFPFRLYDYRIDPQRALVPLRYIRFLRNRYSTFNLIHEVGADERVFGLLDQRLDFFK
jgi:hypothetical protein